jgi:FkbM family methyltransferase
MNFSGVAEKTLIGRLLRFPLKFIPPETRMPILQGRLRGKRWTVGSCSHGCWLGSYEYQKRIVFEKTVTQGSVVFDIGAHVGFYTLLASVMVGSNGRVFAFEPSPRNLFYLKKHLQLNCITNVKIIEAAVSDCYSITSFVEGRGSTMGHISPDGKLLVKTVNLDKLISRGIPIPNFIKIDVEGAEMKVLSGAKSMLANVHPTLFLATHGRNMHIQCCRFLNSLNYKLKQIGKINEKQCGEILAYHKDR